ncbi:MAG: hypothetical protein A2X19_10545 [Bacteroidetes bacterium GWE2_39_28]|nr:MAG: hypothetical protein A2X19_10545 [Bacteroidetes bacterium GWE2_39_28]OFY13560.1 MAG: hypothetical protein A2X16_07835 [Bacteroidetes bacterium GWF2_39_10]OFZ07332.1 MAG: hypothetical protein A2322_01200 [Bacteroidetes bacterium RIFOXYB2_FULL_39_7]OFZ11720.1 MAG: hypothetical protein A2465_05840 [Bacteroidetes bacterium RIFOXYC2_FULL_39_11]HCT94897.1 O-antigen translocase [Rikenellaceae bacterium]
MEANTSYKKVFKATSLFGGVQIIQVILNLLRGKVIALLLGASGMGINSLFVSSVTIIGNVTGLGLNFSSVRDISQAVESGNKEKISRIIHVFSRWLNITALLGMIAVLLFSPLLSSTTFGSNKYTVAFLFLSLMVLFNTLSTGNGSILRGARDNKGYAKLTLTGSAVSLLVSVPLYYFFGIKAIVPALILSAFVTYLFSLYYTSKYKKTDVKMSFRQSITEGGDMVKLGVAMMATTAIASFVHYLLNIFISSKGSVADLGFYQAAMNITNQSIGLIFTAIIIDYQPRLAAVSDDNSKVREMVNHQAEITLLIAAPILILLIITSPLMIRVLLSEEFLHISGLIRVLAFGMIFKAASYSIGAISYAKGDKKVFFLMEGGFTNLSFLIFCSAGYYLGGLVGLGYGFVIMHVIYLVLINIMNRRLYNYYMSKELVGMFSVLLLCTMIAYLSFVFSQGIAAYAIAISASLISLIYSYKQLDKRIGIRDFVQNKFFNKGLKNS